MDQKKYKNSSPRVKVIQKIYGSLMNPDEEIIYPKNQYKKYIKDVVNIFGADRCCFGSNFPPDKLFYELDEIILLVKEALVDLPYPQQRKVFYENALRLYSI